jgi:hypothetical protein
MPNFKTFTGLTNVFADKDGRRYLSGIVHPTAALAVKAQSEAPVGEIVGVAQVVWDEIDDPSRKAWAAKY